MFAPPVPNSPSSPIYGITSTFPGFVHDQRETPLPPIITNPLEVHDHTILDKRNKRTHQVALDVVGNVSDDSDYNPSPTDSPKLGRPRKNPHLTSDERKAQHAAKSRKDREKHKKYVSDLEKLTDKQATVIAKLEDSEKHLKEQNAKLQAEIRTLKQRLNFKSFPT
jgi:hypothetical protein